MVIGRRKSEQQTMWVNQHQLTNPTTQSEVWRLLNLSSFACEKGTPDDLAFESIKQAKSPFLYQTISLARLLAAAV